ncbi:hypothetical protein ACN20G_37210 (plasmid) [Streptomyces sp. BI20]|uniref:hypothetical protein n=1 Tax=Streptomyces sp. BI20 TaxID=3403460 RepID=UPI003C792787
MTMTLREATTALVLLRFELSLGSWRPSNGECDAAAATLSALRSPSVTLDEALVSGTWTATNTAPWELPPEEGGSRLTSLMHHSAEALRSETGADAEEHSVLRANLIEVLVAVLEHRPARTPSWWTRLWRPRTRTATA